MTVPSRSARPATTVMSAAPVWHRRCRWCASLAALGEPANPQRRLFSSALLALGTASLVPGEAEAADGVDVGGESQFARLVPADQVEQAAQQQYQQMLRQAAQKKALAPDTNQQLIRLRSISQRIIPNSYQWNDRARQWKWEVNLIGSREINAFCMPGGKIAFYYGILQKLQLNDDEVAMIMGHEAAHALREHAREQMGKSAATNGVIEIGAALFGLGNTGRLLANMGGQLLTLRFSRANESEADLIGLELAARSGYDPGAGVSLWQKMMKASQGAPPAFLSTHPPSDERIRDIQANLPRVEPLYARADKPDRRYEPPPPAKKS